MNWINTDTNEACDIRSEDIARLEIRIYNLTYVFEELSDMETSNILHYMERISERKYIDDFTKWLITRGISFSLSYEYIGILGLKYNIKSYIYYRKINNLIDKREEIQ